MEITTYWGNLNMETDNIAIAISIAAFIVFLCILWKINSIILKNVFYGPLCLIVLVLWTPIFLVQFILRLLQFGQNFLILKKGLGDVLKDADCGFLFVNNIDCMMNFITHVDGDLDIETLRKTILERAIENEHPSYKRLSQKITQKFGRYSFVDEDNFDIKNHVRIYDDKEIKSFDEVKDIFGDIVSTPLSKEISPWEFLLIPIKSEKPQLIVAARIHHSICDGFGTVGLFGSLIDTKLKRLSFDVKPPSVWKQLFAWLVMWFTGPLFITSMILSTSQNPFPWKKDATFKKTVSWTKGIDVKLVKQVKERIGGTVTDVITACLCGSLRNYLLSKGQNGVKDFHILTSVNFRSIDDFKKTVVPMENKSGGFLSYLPVEIQTAKGRLLEVKKRLGAIRTRSGWRFLSVYFNEVLGLFPNVIGQFFMGNQKDKVCLMLGNVPGPQEQCEINGSKIQKILTFAPMVAASSLTVTANSYAGEFTVGVLSDEDAISNPTELTDLFYEEFKQICKEVLI